MSTNTKKDYIYYNPKVSAFGFNVSVLKCALQIKMAKSLNPNGSGKPKSGDTCFDWTGQLNFSISPEECFKIDCALSQLVAGEYVNPAATDPRYKGVFSIIHFREISGQKKSSILSIKQTKEGMPTVTFSLKPPETNKETLSYAFTVEQLAIFRHFLRAGYQRLPYDCALNDALTRKHKKDDWDEQNGTEG